MRPACEIDPVFSIASSKRIFPGPSSRSLPKSTLNVSRSVSIFAPATYESGQHGIFHRCGHL